MEQNHDTIFECFGQDAASATVTLWAKSDKDTKTKRQYL